jgi:hypothetical protein
MSTPMDALSQLDLTVLHELTHTRAAGESLDVEPGGVSGLLGFTGPYGWKNVVKLKKSNNAGKSL